MSVPDTKTSPPLSRASSTLENQNSSNSISGSSQLTVATSATAVPSLTSPTSPIHSPPSPTRARSGSFINKIAGGGHNPRRSLSSSDAFTLTRQPSSEGSKDGVAIYTTGPVSAPSSIAAVEVQLSGNYDDYDIKTQSPIGYGSSAVVYTAIYKPLQKRVAIKMIDLDMFERNQIDELRKETQLMALSKHPNVLKVYGSFVHGSRLCIVTPFLAGGSCLDIMKTAFPDGFDEVVIATILKQALEGLIYFHKNGHIHRDVKAGNLLMDEDGTVLLADFGVSSSTIENGERGVRRTFVGTPCWMAPEVMEQAGYNSKADIWSFGITAIELATGHAPFAKYPPLKVLMLTLQSDPPTLDSSKSKHSKLLREMIGLCLQKDASKRPTAEKLLQHPFFRQAKKKDFLVRALLTGLPPLGERPHKRAPQKHNTIIKTSAWNFDDENKSSDSSANEVELSNPEQKEQTQGGQPSPIAEKKHIRFEADIPAPNSAPASLPPHGSAPVPIPAPVPERRHISFSDTIVKNLHSPSSPQMGKSVSDLGEPRKSRFVVEDTNIEPIPLSPSTLTPTQGKDNDFLLGLGMANGNVFSEEPKRIDRPSSVQPEKEVVHRKGRFSVTEGSSGHYGSQTHIMIPQRSITPGLEKSQSYLENDAGSIPRAGSTDNLQDRRSRFEVSSSQNPTGVTAPISTATTVATHAGVPLSRENSSSRDSTNANSLSRDSSLSRGRFSVEKDGLASIISPSPQVVIPSLPQGRRSDERDRDGIEIPSCGVGKRGRFQVSADADAQSAISAPNLVKEHKHGDGSHSPPPTGGSDASSQSGSIGGSPSTSPSSSLSRGHSLRFDIGSVDNLYSHLETLIRQNEQQHSILTELFNGVGGAPRSSCSSASQSTVSGLSYTNGGSIHSGQSLNGGHWSNNGGDGKNGSLKSGTLEDMNSNSHPDRNYEQLLRENDYLRRENETIKKDLERLRRSLNATSINVAGGATSNAAAVTDAASSNPILLNGAVKSSNLSGISSAMPASLAAVKFDEKPKDHLTKFEEKRDS